MTSAEELARKLIAEGIAPHAAVGVLSKTAMRLGGDVETIFDLASLTKPATALAIATLGFKDRLLGELVEEARGTWSEETPLELLLAHRAGLSAHEKLYAPMLVGEPVDRPRAMNTAANARREGDTSAPVYSDMGYVLAGEALARATQQQDAGLAITECVLSPLGLGGEIGTSRELGLSSKLARVAPTEDVAWRGGVIHGLVHDENAWALTDRGGSGHAGLFGTITGVLKLGRAALDLLMGHPSPLGTIDIDWMVKERPGGSLRAGFDGKSETGSSAGNVLGPRTFGHLGFTGTSVWIDPDRELVVAILTNRVHPTRENTKIREARPWAHDALATIGND